MNTRRTKLKGGSLNSIYLIEGATSYVRKEISRTENREYGYVRWYSQLKKLQRYQSMFPGLFPQVLNVSYEDDKAYFDLEYLKDYVDIKTLLCTNLDASIIEKINIRLWEAFAVIHTNSYSAPPNISSLYYKEEVEQKLADALQIKEFSNFYEYNTYTYNGEKILGIHNYLDKLKSFFDTAPLVNEEHIHGNPTLENIMYSVANDKIVFIDLYEESIIDTKYIDYAQVLQCSRSHYGFINDRNVSVVDNCVEHSLSVPENFNTFNTYFENTLNNNCVDLRFVNILEATQFIRMLPFKCLSGEIDKAKFFYVHACSLLSKVFA